MDDDNSDDDMDGPGSSNGRSKNNSTGNPINWNGKPKSAVQLAGEALITRIVSEVGMCDTKFYYFVYICFCYLLPIFVVFQEVSPVNW